jgi:hypothetical protein
MLETRMQKMHLLMQIKNIGVLVKLTNKLQESHRINANPK